MARIGGILNDVAALYQEMGRDRAALPLLQRALAIKERVLGPSHPDIASSLNKLAIALDRDESQMQQAVAELGDRVTVRMCDVTVEAEVAAVVGRHLGNHVRRMVGTDGSIRDGEGSG